MGTDLSPGRQCQDWDNIHSLHVCYVTSGVSNSLRPYGLLPTRLWQEYWSGWPCPPPGDLPNTGIEPVSFTSPALADRFFTTLATWKWKSLSRVSLQPHGLYSPWNSPGQNTGVGSLSLFQGIFPIQGSNPGLPHCRQILYQLSYKGSPRILEWIAYPFSSGSSQSRGLIRVSCPGGGFFANWAMREAQRVNTPYII